MISKIFSLQKPFLKTVLKSALLLFFFAAFFIKSDAQINSSGCVGGNFGVDAGLYSGIIEFGAGSPAAGTHDWFKGPTGLGRINESNVAALRSLLQAPGNPNYERRMNLPLASVSAGQILIDAVFARDMFGGTGGIDNTSFNTASKNGEDPAIWDPGPQNVLGKNDLIDVAGHMVRNGTTLGSPLYFFGMINRAEPGGDAYLDFEFFVADVKYSASGGFTSGGRDLGHTAFKFSPNGSIDKIGDVIFNFALTGGGTTASLETRIWVSRADYDANLHPAGFNWGPEFDGAFTGSPFGYASIIPVTTDICGYVNQELENPTAPPWGTKGTKTNTWGTTYIDYSVGEVGINISALGLDHASLLGVDPCYFPLSTFIVKSRASNSFTAQLKDFAGPYTWGQPYVETQIEGNPVISCLNPLVTLSAEPARPDVTYMWTTEDGQINGNANSPTITVNKPGTFTLKTILQSTGCPMPDVSVTVTDDPTKPFFNTPSATFTTSCNGNDGTINLTVSGATPPYSYSWTKNGSPYNVTTEDLTGLAPGTYVATITDFWGCNTILIPVVVPGRTPAVITSVITQVTCNGLLNGSINISVTGKGPFTYLWSNGQTTEDLTNIAAGNYNVAITDADGCITTATFTVTQPAVLGASAIKTNETDASLNNGTINLSVTGGTPAYTYLWAGPNGFSATTEDLTGLARGTYTVTVTDSNGCITTLSVVIFEPEVCDDGIDNDGDNLTDCQDITDCKPAQPGTITASKVTPCIITETATYSITAVAGHTYNWTVPANATILSGQGTNSIVVRWDATGTGDICVVADRVGCLSSPRCLTVSPKDVPTQPGSIIKN